MLIGIENNGEMSGGHEWQMAMGDGNGIRISYPLPC